MKQIIKYPIFLLVFSLFMFSCVDDEFLTEMPKDKLTAENLFTNRAGFENGMNSLYSLVRLERGRFQELSNLENITDMYATASNDNTYIFHFDPFNRAIHSWGSFMNSENQQLRAFFQWLYKIINTCNLIISRAENPSINWTEAEKAQILAEVRTIRAWAYRHATYTWGDVPFTLEEATGSNIKTDWVRTPKEQIWESMKQDWLYAEKNLAEIHPHPGKISRAVPQHYLAELYLQLNKADSAEIMANKVINSGKYALITARYGVKRTQPGVPFMDQFYDGNVNRCQ